MQNHFLVIEVILAKVSFGVYCFILCSKFKVLNSFF
jgi:hypothetical protein